MNMKKIALSVIASLIIGVGFAQINNPVKWNFSSKKIDDKTYELHFTANIQPTWNIYSQSTPEGGPLPTAITITKNPLVTVTGKAKEVGSMKKKHEETFEVDVYYYENRVDFVQTVQLKSKAVVTVTGNVAYMACDAEQCLPEAKVPFSLKLQ